MTLLPTIIEKFGEAAIERMAELAEIARAEEEHWELGHAEVRGLSEGRAQRAAIRCFASNWSAAGASACGTAKGGAQMARSECECQK